MNIYLMRHGETDMNNQNRLQGRLNTELNEKGKNDALKAGEFLRKQGIRIDEVWASPLERTIVTAENASGIARSDDRFKMEERIIEVDFGPFEGSTISEDETAYTHTFFSDPAHCVAPEGVESFDELMVRAENFLDSLFEYYMEYKDEDYNLLLTSHGGFSHAVICDILNLPLEEFWSMPVRNCSVHRLVPGDEEFVDIEVTFEGFLRKNMRKF